MSLTEYSKSYLVISRIKQYSFGST